MDSRFSMLPIAVLSDRRLTYRQLVVFAALCSFRQGAGDYSIRAGRDEISARCGLHRSVISSATTELESLGWLTKTGHGGRSLKSEYRITIPETVAEHVTVTHHATVTEGETVTHHVSKTVAHHATSLYRTEVNRQMRVSKSKDSDPEGFADFWKLYPRKTDKQQAMKAWRNIKPTGQMLVVLMDGLKRQAASADWLKEGGKFIPYPATWLNGRRWEDEAMPYHSSTPALNPVFAGAV